MKFNFDTPVNRKNIGNMKSLTTPEKIKNAGFISYAGAEMEFKTAPSIINAIVDRAENGLLGFTLPDEQYLSAVQWWMKTQRNYKIEQEWIVPTLGTIHALCTTIRFSTDEGDGVIIQTPVYDRYDQAISRLHRKTVHNPLIHKDGAYSIDFGHLETLMADEHNKLLILCNPHNPISRVWPEEDLKKIASLAEKYGVIVFSDEIFAQVVFDGHICHPFCQVEGAQEIGITATSLGKAFNFTGVNHANLIIPDPKLRQAFTVQRNADHYGSLDPLIHAAVCGAYTPEGAAWKDAMVAYVRKNIAYIQNAFSEHLPKISISPPEGCFVIWLDWRKYGLAEEELKHFLINKAYLLLIMGSNYGESGRGFTRMNVATPISEIKKSLARLWFAAKRYS